MQQLFPESKYKSKDTSNSNFGRSWLNLTKMFYNSFLGGTELSCISLCLKKWLFGPNTCCTSLMFKQHCCKHCFQILVLAWMLWRGWSKHCLLSARRNPDGASIEDKMARTLAQRSTYITEHSVAEILEEIPILSKENQVMLYNYHIGSLALQYSSDV